MTASPPITIAMSADCLKQAATVGDAIVHAINVNFPDCDPLMIGYTQRIIELSQRYNAQLFLVGNIDNTGIPDSGFIDTNTPDQPVHNKGEIRARLETMIREGAR